MRWLTIPTTLIACLTLACVAPQGRQGDYCRVDDDCSGTLLCLAHACHSPPAPATNDVIDGSVGRDADVTMDAATDSGDASTDASMAPDASMDAHTDAAEDASSDAAEDAAEDASSDAASDASSGVDTMADAGA